MHLSGGIVDRDSAGLLLLLFLRIVGSEVRRNTLPRLTVVARTEQELRSDIDRSLLVGTHVDGRVPVKAQFLFAVLWKRLDVSSLVRVTIDAANIAALRFGVDVCGI